MGDATFSIPLNMRKLALTTSILIFLCLNIRAQDYVIDSLYSQNGIFSTPILGILLNSEIIEYEDGD